MHRKRGKKGGGVGGWGERERVAGQETSSADEVIGLKIKRWRHLKPIPVNELSGAPGKGGDRRGQGGGRRAGPRARPPIPRPPEPGARPRAPFGRSGRGRVTLGSGVRRLWGRFCGRPLGGAEAARGGDPVASSFRARPPARPAPGAPRPPGPGRAPSALRPSRYLRASPPLNRRAFFSLLGCFQLPHQREETQTMMWENYHPSLKSLTNSKCRAQLYLLRKRRCRYFKKSHTGVGHAAICRWKPSRECSKHYLTLLLCTYTYLYIQM